MRIVIRVDASIEIGIGHLMRCITLAENLRERGAHIHFICRQLAGSQIEMLQERNFLATGLSSPEIHRGPHDSGDGLSFDVTQKEDAKQTIDALWGRVDLLIVDHYALDIEWEQRLRPYTKKIMVIDDLANRRHDCDILLDQNFFEDEARRYQGIVPKKCLLLLGPRYALLRPEYQEHSKRLPPVKENIENIFIFFGGSDPFNLTSLALKALSCNEFSHLNVDIVVGSNNCYHSSIVEQALLRPNTKTYGPLLHLADLMVRADLAIGAGGSTTWERLALGLPSLVITIAENQVPTSRALNSSGYIRLIGNAEDVDFSHIRNALYDEVKMSNSPQRHLARRLLCDGGGVLRVGDELLNNLDFL